MRRKEGCTWCPGLNEPRVPWLSPPKDAGAGTGPLSGWGGQPGLAEGGRASPGRRWVGARMAVTQWGAWGSTSPPATPAAEQEKPSWSRGPGGGEEKTQSRYEMNGLKRGQAAGQSWGSAWERGRVGGMKRRQHMAGCVEGEQPAPAPSRRDAGVPAAAAGCAGPGLGAGNGARRFAQRSKSQGVRGPRHGRSASPFCGRKATPEGRRRVPSPPRRSTKGISLSRSHEGLTRSRSSQATALFLGPYRWKDERGGGRQG